MGYLFALLLAGYAAVAQPAEWPWPTCPVKPDSQGLGRPPIMLEAGTFFFPEDKSVAHSARLICRDTRAVLLWTWQIESCNGPCVAAMFPWQHEDYFPPAVANSCEGCIYPRRHAVDHE